MAFLNQSKFKELREASKNGNEKASMVLQAMIKGGNQEDIDRLVEDYYSIPKVDFPQQEMSESPTIEPEMEPTIEPEMEPEANITDYVEEPEDLSEILDKETDGLFDENEIDGGDFSKFLSNKKRDGNRMKKNAEYFKAFNPQSVENYSKLKKEAYKNKFGDNLHDIDRNYSDYDKSLDLYLRNVNDMLDDDIEVDMNQTGCAYDEITENNGMMHCFGRHWDEVDTGHVMEDLKPIVAKYGKKNVISALNVLKSDNLNFKNYRVGQINEEIERYNKSLDKLFK